ncbi:hypothetical protein [Litoreibacter arenae]|uniref:PepSY domain-containing protein n=1 Tax=Litoreibacter arenae DSM 19593 TaxID=1123360 RepID=S9RGJ7_9RHOB|nr:hypothetical protein [Litoreibacter arenae]EPX77205.1 hypothetical protein thalar_02927 [Litoreibacter arenae DSM 19593]
MFKSILLLGALAIGFTTPSIASSAREMGQSELRQIASSGGTVSIKAMLSSVSKSLHAQVVEARAFDAGGVYYRFVLKQDDGKLVSVILDAQTGLRVPSKSPIARQVAAAASPRTNTGSSGTE